MGAFVFGLYLFMIFSLEVGHAWLCNLGEGIGVANFVYYDVQNYALVKDFLIARGGYFSFHICRCVFCNSN